MSEKATEREVKELMQAAEEWGREAGEFAMRYYGHRVKFEDKLDGTPVTVADRGAEQLLRERIGARFPDHAVLGEEYGESNPGARVRWVLDPVDATRAFTRGVPIWGVLIGIEVAGEAVVGVSNFPAMREIVVAGRGLGCFWNGERAHVSDTTTVEQSVVLTTDVERVLKRPEGAGFRRLQKRALFARTWGDCYGYVLVATGRAELMLDPIVSLWDCAALMPVIVEAGGTFTDWTGAPTIYSGEAIATNRLLFDATMRLIGERGA